VVHDHEHDAADESGDRDPRAGLEMKCESSTSRRPKSQAPIVASIQMQMLVLWMYQR